MSTPKDITVPSGWLSKTGRNRDLPTDCIAVEVTNSHLILVYQVHIFDEADAGTYTYLWLGGRKVKLSTVMPAGVGDTLTTEWRGAMSFDTETL